jgi:hypothetical protein
MDSSNPHQTPTKPTHSHQSTEDELTHSFSAIGIDGRKNTKQNTKHNSKYADADADVDNIDNIDNIDDESTDQPTRISLAMSTANEREQEQDMHSLKRMASGLNTIEGGEGVM